MLDRTIPPSIHPIEDLKLAPIRTMRLDNGITLKVLDRGHDEVNRLVAVRAGGLMEAPDKAIAGLMGRMLCEGTESMSGAEIAERLELNGSWFNAVTRSHHHTLSMSSINSRFSHVAPVMADIWQSPAFPDDSFEVKREMMAKKTEEMLLKVAPVADRVASELAMGRHNPLAADVTPEDIRHTSAQSVRDFYHKCADSAQTTLYLAGRITPAVEDEVNRSFGTLPAPQNLLPDSGMKIVPFVNNRGEGLEKASFGPVEKVTVKDALQAAVYMVLPAVPRSHPDFVPLRLAVMTLGGYFGSRLMTNVREDKGYTYGIGANLLGYIDGSYIQIATECDSDYVYPLIDEVVKEIGQMSTRKVDSDELMRVRQNLTSSLLSIIDTPFTSIDHYINMELVGTPANYFNELLTASKTINTDKIVEMSEKYLRPSLMQTVIAGA